MDTFKNEMVWYAVGTNEALQYFYSTVNGTLLHYCCIDFKKYHIVPFHSVEVLLMILTTVKLSFIRDCPGS